MQSPWWYPILTTVLPSAVIPVGLAMLANLYFNSARWTNEPFHSLVEGVGSFAAILLALFIIIMRRSEQLSPGYIWVATTLMGMGLLDGFHASIPPGQAFVWLHSVATFIGGLTFALVTLPDRISRLPQIQFAPYLVASSSVIFGLLSIIMPGWIPTMAINGQFTAIAEFLNIAGGIGFTIAWFHFAWRARQSNEHERLLLANHCLLFGMAGMLFHFSVLWDVTWWLWHVLRLFAYLVILWFFLELYNDDVKRLRISQIALKQRSNELQRTQQRLSDIIEHSPSAIAIQDTRSHFILANRQFKQLFDLGDTDISGKAINEILPESISEMELAQQRQVLDEGITTSHEETLPLRDGPRTFISSRFPLFGSNNRIYGMGCIFTDISERKSMEERLRLAQKVIENTSEAVVITDPGGIIVEINNAYTQITGYEREEVIGLNPRFSQSGHHDKQFYQAMWSQLADEGYWSGEIWDRRKDGEAFPKWLTINAIYNDDDSVSHYVGIFTDISEKKDTEKKLKNLAFYDPLTGLPNRVFFLERLNEALITSQRHRNRTALLFIDLDRFKDVNDTLGHNAGDELIIQASRRIRRCLRQSDTVARLGGDEFTVILTEISNEASIAYIAQQIIEQLCEPFMIYGTEVYIGASVGISVYPDDSDSSETLLKNADTAMYHAKDNGRGNFQFYRDEMNARMLRRVTLERNLRHALENDEFVLHYQPRYSLPEAKIIGMEALVRWNHPKEGLVPPSEFIPLAEETNLIIPLGEWVLHTACAQAKAWEHEGLGSYRMAVNLSSRQFQQLDLIQQVRNALQHCHMDPTLLELEITESIVMKNPEEVASLLAAIRRLGVHISIDDFGTGYSSLAYLKKFPINALKIDRSFVNDLPDDNDDVAIVESIIGMTRSLGIEVVAEGVETPEQVEFLQSRGCKEVQGYYFSKPLPPKEMSELLRKSTGHSSKSSL